MQDGLHTVLLRLCDASYDLPQTLLQGTSLLQLLPTAPVIKKVRIDGATRWLGVHLHACVLS